MVPQIGFLEVAKFMTALSICTGAMAWWRRGSEEEDEVVSESVDVVLGSISDADKVSNIDLATGKNLRDQITVEQAMEMNEERSLRRWGFGRN